jgi:hypothetical protein
MELVSSEFIRTLQSMLIYIEIDVGLSVCLNYSSCYEGDEYLVMICNFNKMSLRLLGITSRASLE